MKKIFFLVVLMSIMLLSACGSPTDSILEDLLYDFDYMMQLMEDTFPYFGVAERRLGIDIRELAQETRATIVNYPYSLQEFAKELGIELEDMPELDEQVFWGIVMNDFFLPLFPLGHAVILGPSGYHSQLASIQELNPESHPFFYHQIQTLSNDTSQRFYEERASLLSTLIEEDPALFEFISRIETISAVFPMSPPPATSRDFVITDIIEEGRIAYLQLPSFSVSNFGNINQRLSSFYGEIQEYEHLIIDIRGNPGGATQFWQLLIMYQLWVDRDTMPNMPLYVFYNGSELGRFLGEAQVKDEFRPSGFVSETSHLLTVNEILDSNHLPHLHGNDLQNLGYGVRYNTSLSNFNQEHFNSAWTSVRYYPFHGQIWLLTNEQTLSAAAMFAHFAKYMDFAILVGEQTGGLYASFSATSFALPNTGIIVEWDIEYLTDQYGRALEEVLTTPHYFNRPNMDALETVLQMIEEGSY